MIISDRHISLNKPHKLQFFFSSDVKLINRFRTLSLLSFHVKSVAVSCPAFIAARTLNREL